MILPNDIISVGDLLINNKTIYYVKKVDLVYHNISIYDIKNKEQKVVRRITLTNVIDIDLIRRKKI